MKKAKIILAVIAVVALGWFLFNRERSSPLVVIDRDLSVEGDYTLAESAVVKGDVKISATGTVSIEKKLSCEEGGLSISAGRVKVTGTLECMREAKETVGVPVENAITIVAQNGITFGDDAEVISNGHVQIVDTSGSLLSQETIAAAYAETAEDSGTGPRIGPFVEENATVSSVFKNDLSPAISSRPFSFVKVANAQVPTDKEGRPVTNVVIGGTWRIGEGGAPPSGLQVPTPPKKVNKILIYFDFGKNGDVTLKDFHLIGPDGRDGKSDEGASCNARGERGEDAFRMRVRAGNLTINNFRLELGDGGAGGAAETKKDCDPGIAKGGEGGAAGNFKMTAEEKISIVSFHIVPGVGGAGGLATAYGKDGTDGCPGEKGGDATATGGDGGKNKKELAAAGAVEGIGNVTIDPVEGGIGATAEAFPGKGGNGTGCNCHGGAGGKGTATGGKGGDASLQIVGTAGTAEGGDGGDAETRGGEGGAGGACPLKPSGGNGGKGGDAKGKGGTGGKGTSANGDDGNIEDETGGNGGNGGDGCGPGKGGKGGKGNPPGQDGKDGTLLCPDTKKKTDTTVTPPPSVTLPTTPPSSDDKKTSPPPPASGQMIEVIKYGNNHLPVKALIIEDEAGCGARHWHAERGVVMSVEGNLVPDPGPQCGYGKVKDIPVIKVPQPASPDSQSGQGASR